jgi:hypothetical protein
MVEVVSSSTEKRRKHDNPREGLREELMDMRTIQIQVPRRKEVYTDREMTLQRNLLPLLKPLL